MDWRCTRNYVRALAEAEGVSLRVSWRKNGFFGELYRLGASEPVEWEEPGSRAAGSAGYQKTMPCARKSGRGIPWGGRRAVLRPGMDDFHTE